MMTDCTFMLADFTLMLTDCIYYLTKKIQRLKEIGHLQILPKCSVSSNMTAVELLVYGPKTCLRTVGIEDTCDCGLV